MTNISSTHALKKCQEWHGNQKRKYTNEPYWKHPLSVSCLMMNIGAPVEAIVTAMLHDIIEDTTIGFEIIRDEFNLEVACLVLEVTDVSSPSNGNRRTRKEIDRQHLATASFWGKSIKLADLIDNTRSIVKHDKEFAIIYLQEKELLLETLALGHCGLLAHAKDVLDLSKQILGVSDV